MPFFSSEFLSAVKQAKAILLIPHRNPDGDAIGSTVGMRDVLRSIGKTADVLIDGGYPALYNGFCEGVLTGLSLAEFEKYDTVLCIDCANRERLAIPGLISFEELQSKIWLNLDHHGSNSLNAQINEIFPHASSSCFLTAKLSGYLVSEISSFAATMFLTGLMTDTGSFRFSNTDAASLKTAACLLESGADLERISNSVFLNKAKNVAEFEADLLCNFMHYDFDGRLAYAKVTSDLLDKHHFQMKDDEGVINRLTELSGVVVAMLIYHTSNGLKVSLRSKDNRFPVRSVAMEFCGGGHALAAGATLKTQDFAEAEKLMLAAIARLLGAAE